MQVSKQYTPVKLRERKAKFTLVNNSAFSKKSSNVEVETEKSSIYDEKVMEKNPSLVYFGHANWNLVLNLMVGMRMSIKALYEPNSFVDLKDSHFTESHEFLLGSKKTNGQFFSEYYKFIEIAPMVF